MTQNTENALDALDADLSKILGETELKQRRTIPKRFYVDEAEERQIEELRQGVSLSAFVRSRVFGTGYRPRAIVPQINREAYLHLTKLSSNCNQMARAINVAAQQNRSLPLTQAYLDQLEQLKGLIIEIGQQLRGQSEATINEEEP